MDNSSKQRYGRQLILPEFGMKGYITLGYQYEKYNLFCKDSPALYYNEVNLYY